MNTKRIVHGAFGGLLGGLVYGAILGTTYTWLQARALYQQRLEMASAKGR